MNHLPKTLIRILAIVSALTLLACYVANSQRKTAPSSKSIDQAIIVREPLKVAPGSKSAPVQFDIRKGSKTQP